MPDGGPQAAEPLTSEFRLSFDDMLLELSSKFTHLPAEQVEPRIDGALREIIAFLGFDRGTLAEFAESDGMLHVVCSAWMPSIEPVPKGPYALPWIVNELRQGRLVSLPSIPDCVPPEAGLELRRWTQSGLRSTLVIPIDVGGRIVGGIGFGAFHSMPRWPQDLVARLRTIGEVFLQALVRCRAEAKLLAALLEVKRLRDHLQEENACLRHSVRDRSSIDRLNSHSPRFRAVVQEIAEVASTNATVLLLGETGTGKELMADAIHALSPRCQRAIVKVNCAALPSSLIEAELFGREKGAYTGALTRQLGRFELAHESTLFLDEIGELALELQVKLLRVLQEGRFERVGSTKTVTADVRVVAATNRDLAEAVNRGTFREDLYYRLNVFPIELPPLRERREDILMLAWHFIKEFNQRMGRHIESIDEASVEALQRYSWPGNVRELRNAIERAMILTHDLTLHVVLPRGPGSTKAPPASLAEIDRLHILKVLETCHWRIRGAKGAAALLNIKATTLESRMKRLGIARPM
jgi:formate hydrogenlyase transcriptional activator